jgi:hypothetical protein
MRRFGFRMGFGIFFAVLAGIAVFSGLVMLLWNNLLPALFHLPLITFWQALGLLILTKILFSGFRSGGGWGRGGHWRQNMHRKWMEMSPEDRERFKSEWRSRCGGRFEKEKSATSDPAQQI